jgi:hypothetical protein
MPTEKIWQKNAASQIVLDSIFAALAVVWITVALPDNIPTKLKFVELIFSILSFFIFASSAEGTTNAYEENDLLKFVYYLLWYNIGVILIGLAIGALVYHHFVGHLVRFVGPILWCLPPFLIHLTVLILWLLLGVFFLWRWLYDAWWLLCKNKQEFADYLKELNDDQTPKHQRHWLMRVLFRRRIADEKSAT